MAHKLMGDDENIIRKCRDYGFCCTFDTENSFQYESVTGAIREVLKSRACQAEKLGRMIARTSGIIKPLRELIAGTKELAQISGNGIGISTNHQDLVSTYHDQLVKEEGCLADNLGVLEEAKRVMDRKNIRVPVVGVINSGKSTFLHSALGGGMNDKVKENLFPSAGGHKSCTGTRTILIYDDCSKDVTVTAVFKDKVTFKNDCMQSICRMVQVLKNLEMIDQFTELSALPEQLKEKSDAVALLKDYAQSAEFHALCKIHYKNEKDAESVHDFCSFVYFSKNEDYSEDRMDMGMPKTIFRVENLIKSWKEGTDYKMQISSDHDFESVKNFVCKYDPSMKQGADRYTTYCGVQMVEIRGNLCGEIAGLELIDSVGANDDAISNEDQMKALMQDSDAMILLERPQPQAHEGWSVIDYVQFVREQKKASDQFLYLIYNCYHNNITIPSDLSHDIDNANKYYSEDCKRIYVSDIGEWKEVQSNMLVDMLVNLSNSVEETHKDYLNLAKNANSDISGSILVIRQIAESLGQICTAENGNASEKKENIEKIIQQLFGEVRKLILETENENETTLRIKANDTTENLLKGLNFDFKSDDFFNIAYEYVSPAGSRYIFNRYTAFLCLYSHMLEDIKRQYHILKNAINTYVENKRQALLKILWETGRFQCMMPDLESERGSEIPSSKQICGWLRKDARELLADVLEELLLQDIGTESLIDGSIGKVIEQFDPKNLTVDQLFGQQISDPNLENKEAEKVKAIAGQLSIKAKELQAALLKSVTEISENAPKSEKTVKGNGGKKKDDFDWDDILNQNSQNKTEALDSKLVQNSPAVHDNIFDLDKKVRKDVVCDGILEKFWDKLRGDGLSQNVEKPISQLYNMYDHYYDVLLSKEEVSYKKRLSELRHTTEGLARQLAERCKNEQ